MCGVRFDKLFRECGRRIVPFALLKRTDLVIRKTLQSGAGWCLCKTVLLVITMIAAYVGFSNGVGDGTCVNIYISPFRLRKCQRDAAGDTTVDATVNAAVVGGVVIDSVLI